MYVLNARNLNPVYDKTGENRLNKESVNYHLAMFTAMGFSPPTAKRLIERMRDMEMLGLEELSNITKKEKEYFSNKRAVANDLSILQPPG
jgi:hypothetical protein